MSLWKGWLDRIRGEAGKAAVDTAVSTASAAAADLAEGILSMAEGELEEARAARGLGPDEDPEPLLDAPSEASPAAPMSREAREEQARAELARLKASMGMSDPDGET